MATVSSDGLWKSSFAPVIVESNPFCAGLAAMADGSIFIAGGDNQAMPAINGKNNIYNGRKGLRTYTPCPPGAPASCSGSWKDLPSMTTERWYPSVVTLADGS